MDLLTSVGLSVFMVNILANSRAELRYIFGLFKLEKAGGNVHHNISYISEHAENHV